MVAEWRTLDFPSPAKRLPVSHMTRRKTSKVFHILEI